MTEHSTPEHRFTTELSHDGAWRRFEARASDVSLNEYQGRGYLERDPHDPLGRQRGIVTLPIAAHNDVYMREAAASEEKHIWTYRGRIYDGDTWSERECKVLIRAFTFPDEVRAEIVAVSPRP